MGKKTKLPLKEEDNIFDLVIPAEVEAKIRHLCSVVHDVEWSGTLFYRYEGSIEEGTFRATCVDICVMDVGSSTYTEFKESPDVINYRVNNDLLAPSIMEGLIHSHNNMATFFSATDKDTLVEEGTNVHHFLSLIVNNAGTYTAAVTRRVTIESRIDTHLVTTTSKYYDSYDGERVVLDEGSVTEEDKTDTKATSVIEYFKLNIIKEEIPNIFSDLDARISEIRRSKYAAKASSYSRSPHSKGYSSYPSSYPSSSNTGNYPKIVYPDSVVIVGDKDKDEKKDEDIKEITTPSSVVPPSYHSKYDAEEVPLCLIESFDDQIIESVCKQLLTGSIILNTEAIDSEEWVKKMDTFYEKRFGPLDDNKHPSVPSTIIAANNEKLETWIAGMVEFLVNNTSDPVLLNRLNAVKKSWEVPFEENDIEVVEICAYCMYDYLEKLPDSYVKDAMMLAIYAYIPNGAKDD